MGKEKKLTIDVLGTTITVLPQRDDDYISLADMLKVKDGDFFISGWLRNRNTVEFLGIWERVHNPDFNYGEFAIIKSKLTVCISSGPGYYTLGETNLCCFPT
ncbi:MAG: KilA-N domain-containing protein [Gallionella sp.]|nr:MAG: KilA-N domain-containing protein [Gallionella sp.]